MPTQYDNK
jgi:hypothetical protein